jgi:hypothetical protein
MGLKQNAACGHKKNRKIKLDKIRKPERYLDKRSIKWHLEEE